MRGLEAMWTTCLNIKINSNLRLHYWGGGEKKGGERGEERRGEKGRGGERTVGYVLNFSKNRSGWWDCNIGRVGSSRV